ncbi:MAG: galactosyltransferase-related protein [bacterium]
MKKASFIISHKRTSIERERNIDIVLKWFKQILQPEDDIEIVIVEQGEKQTLDPSNYRDLPYTLSYLFVQKSGYFNKSWGYNIGANMAKSDILNFIDNDIILPRASLEAGFELLDRVDAVRCYDRLYALTNDETNQLSVDINSAQLSKHTLRDFSVPGGYMLIRRDLFYNVGGWDEEFEGWGGEDTAFGYKLLPYQTAAVTEVAFHLHHENYGTSTDTVNFESVRQVYKQITSLSHEQILERAKAVRIGDIHRFVRQSQERT